MNIDEILEKHSLNYKHSKEIWRQDNATLKGSEVKAAIKEIIEETLRMASENADLNQNGRNIGHATQDGGSMKIYEVDKQSILDVIKQITI